MSTNLNRLKRGLRDTLILAAHHLIPHSRSVRSAKRIIALHDVEASHATAFRQHMTFLREHFEILPLFSLLESPTGDRVQVALTFDDGYASWAETAAPILSELEIPALFFICSGLVDLDALASARFYRERLWRKRHFAPLRSAHVEALAVNPLFEIGGHTVNHVDLGSVADPVALEAEIAGDRAALERLTGRPVRYFAWPFGASENLSSMAREAIVEAGFEAAFTTIPGRYQLDGDPMRIGRDMLSLEETPSIWEARLQGAYDFFYRLRR